MSDKSLRLPESLYNVPPKFTLSEFRVYVFPVLASLASYHAHLEPNLQQRLIKCLEVRHSSVIHNSKLIRITEMKNSFSFSSLTKYFNSLLGWPYSKMCEPMRNQSHNLHTRNARCNE